MAHEVVKKEASLPSTGKMPSFMTQYIGEGQEDITNEDIKMPRLKLGQPLSPEVKDGDAQAGDFYNNVTREIICPKGESVLVVPVYWGKEYILWGDRDGPNPGILARARRVYDEKYQRYRFKWDKPNTTFTDVIRKTTKVEWTTKEYADEDGLADWGSQIPGDPESKPAATTHYNYVFMLPEHGGMMMAASLSRTQQGKAEELNTMLRSPVNGMQVPTYGRTYYLRSFLDKRGNNEFWNVKFTVAGVVEDEATFNSLRDLYNDLKTSGVIVDFSEEDNGTTIDAEEDDRV